MKQLAMGLVWIKSDSVTAFDRFSVGAAPR